MGSLQAQEMAGMADRDSALAWHFRANHYPALPSGLVPVAVEAIEAAIEGEWDRLIDLQGEAVWRGKSAAPVSACVESWHLDPWIEEEV